MSSLLDGSIYDEYIGSVAEEYVDVRDDYYEGISVSTTPDKFHSTDKLCMRMFMYVYVCYRAG